jgi:polar amino acid transport system substrate-binding protein
VLRFSVAESWSMPLMRIEQGQPVEGILFELMQAAAREAGAAQYHVMARLRLQEAMESGDIDVRCYVSTQWLTSRPAITCGASRSSSSATCWSAAPATAPLAPTPSPQALGTVLGYSYPTLAPLFARGQLQREDSRNQELALQSCRPGAIGMP